MAYRDDIDRDDLTYDDYDDEELEELERTDPDEYLRIGGNTLDDYCDMMFPNGEDDD